MSSALPMAQTTRTVTDNPPAKASAYPSAAGKAEPRDGPDADRQHELGPVRSGPKRLCP